MVRSSPSTRATATSSATCRTCARSSAKLSERTADGRVRDGDVDVALEQRHVALVEGIVEELLDARRELARGRGLEVDARHLVDLDDQRRHRLEPGEERIVGDELKQLRRTDA